MKIKKAINTLQNQTTGMSEADAQSMVTNLLVSYERQLRYGCIDKLIAFSNSVYTPTNKIDKYKEATLQEQKKKLKHRKYRIALVNEELITKMRKEGSSYQQIATYINQYIVHKRQYFNKKYIERFCKNKNINSRI